MYFIWHDIPIECEPGVPCKYPNGNDLLRQYSITDRVDKYTGALIGLLVGWRLLAFLMLWLAARRSTGARRR